jgi:hypothetical protein
MKQRVEEIGAGEQRDGEADDGLRHDARPLQSSAGADIEGHESEEKGAERQIDEIEHRWSPQ